MYCDNSIYIKNRLMVENYINKVCNFSNIEFAKSNIKANLYVSGSLARQEPTVQIINDNVQLTSDIDFVLVYNKSQSTYNEVMRNIIKIKNEFPETDCSFAVISTEDLKKTSSFFKRDLSLSFDNPIYKNINLSFSDLGDYSISRFNYIESIITQSCCYFLNPEKTENKSYNCFFKACDYHLIKLILECFRGLVYDENVVGYNDLLLKELYKLLPEEYSLSLVEKCIKVRELSLYNSIPNINVLVLIDITMSKLFGKKRYYDDIIAAIPKMNDEVRIFQNVTILFLMAINNKIEWKIISEMLHFIPFSKELVTKITKCIKKYISAKKDEYFESILVAYRELRNVYVSILHTRNTAELNFSDVEAKK